MDVVVPGEFPRPDVFHREEGNHHLGQRSNRKHGIHILLPHDLMVYSIIEETGLDFVLLYRQHDGIIHQLGNHQRRNPGCGIRTQTCSPGRSNPQKELGQNQKKDSRVFHGIQDE